VGILEIKKSLRFCVFNQAEGIFKRLFIIYPAILVPGPSAGITRIRFEGSGTCVPLSAPHSGAPLQDMGNMIDSICYCNTLLMLSQQNIIGDDVNLLM